MPSQAGERSLLTNVDAAKQVAERGCKVHGIVRYRTHWGNLAGMLDGSVVMHKGDITDAAFVSPSSTFSVCGATRTS